MKTITENENTKVVVTDEPGKGGACHRYDIMATETGEELAWIQFQKGPIPEAGVNGHTIEDLLAICIHRLEGFQSGEFACSENLFAISMTRQALTILEQRTKDRQDRGVEGTNKK